MRLRNAALGLIALAALVGCGSNGYGTGTGGGGGSGSGGGGGGGGGGPVGSVTVGAAIQFVSGHNGSHNPAVDTIAVGGTVTWTWGANSGAYGGHSVQSVGSQSFASSAVQSSGTYSLTFTSPGIYQYDCAVHGSAMTGTVVVR